ncbi:hypothetical protein C0991_006306 [Blastosporella zonata]|nr:hypothetical protein C0991_006306 [Blastosporella zonata]
MAQAVFDEHPLEQYLRNAGEAQDLMPGSTIELESELDPWWATELGAGEEEDEGVEWRPLFMIQAIEVIMAMISELGLPPPSHSSPFVEHFKYDVISSSLLAVSLPLTHPRTPRSPVPTIPGQLNHSRTSSLSNTHTPTSLPAAPTDSSYLIPSLSLIAFAVFIHAGHIPLALASFGITVYTFNAHDTQKHDMSPCLETLDELIASSNEWEAVVQTAISVVDSDEQSFSFGPATPQSPSSSLRVALHSSLLTTQTQCDNVRQLFAALTLPSELSQLSEMYAPPSPMASSSFSQDSHTRPLSLPSRRRTLSMPSNPLMSPESKRQTWTGSYSRLNQLGSPGFKVQRKRRSDLTSLLQASPSPTFMTASAPVTPATSSLPYVSEESDSEYEDAHEQLPNTADGSMTFGSAALALHRKRRTVGMEAFRLPPPSYFSPVSSPRLTPQSPRTPPRPSSTYVSGSRLTPVQAGRHPLSLSALHHALQNALASKRFACSHLLALRFADEEDDGYWEDVRSVMGLLTTTLSDASSRLSEAITEVEQQKLRDQNPTPPSYHSFLIMMFHLTWRDHFSNS